jgi:nucleoside-diphosphate-sugar epimerase
MEDLEMTKRILVTGNLGYIGHAVTRQLKKEFPSAFIIGYDTGFFEHQLTVPQLAENFIDLQVKGDVREFDEALLTGVDAIVHLAAISNDPIGNKFAEVTDHINYVSSIAIAEMAKRKGVKKFVFASSCSVYGFAEDGAKKENSELNPLTPYARSKVMTESSLQPMAGKDFEVVCLRFATACGMSERLRLDLVLNDFVAAAVSAKEIRILSDGSPWRPLINIKDMARAIGWAVAFHPAAHFLVVNAGSEEWNYQVKDLAEHVKKLLPGISISINKDAAPDKRSYRVDFSLFKELAPHHQPVYDIAATIHELIDGLKHIQFDDPDFRSGELMRLNRLTGLMSTQKINDKLFYQ